MSLMLPTNRIERTRKAIINVTSDVCYYHRTWHILIRDEHDHATAVRRDDDWDKIVTIAPSLLFNF